MNHSPTDEHLENLVPIQHLYCIRNTSNKQTRSFHARKEIKTIQCSNFPNAIFILIAESISRINIFCYSQYSEQFLADVTPYFLPAVQFSFSCLLQGFASCYYLISKHKQYTFRTFDQISKLQGKQ